MGEKEKSIIPGVALIVLGAVLLFNQLDLIYFRWRDVFPFVLLGIGIFMFFSAMKRSDKGAVFPGTVLIILGLFFVIRNFGFFSLDFYFYDMRDYWPIFLIALGAGFVVTYFFKPDDWGTLIPGGILLFLGAIFTLRNLDIVDWFRVAELWPVILIAIGVFLVVGSFKRKPN